MVCVPAFHRLNAPTIRHAVWSNQDGLCQRRMVRGREDCVVQRKFQHQFVQSLSQGGDRFQLCYLRICVAHALSDLTGCSWL